jgi:hypothetical protein
MSGKKISASIGHGGANIPADVESSTENNNNAVWDNCN